ncbi:MAG: hypothetical protein SGPRY_004458 [Prymnesium sp.]
MARTSHEEAWPRERSDQNEQAKYREMKRELNLQLQVEALAIKGGIRHESAASRTRSAGTPSDVDEYPEDFHEYLRAEDMHALEVIQRADLRSAKGDDSTTYLFDEVLSLTDYQICQLATHLRLALVKRGIPMTNGQSRAAAAGAIVEHLCTTMTSGSAATSTLFEVGPRDTTAMERMRTAVTLARSTPAPRVPSLAETLHTSTCQRAASRPTATEQKKFQCGVLAGVGVADGVIDQGRNTKPLSAAAKTLAPHGMRIIIWVPEPDRGEDEDITCWYLLDPKKWNKDNKHHSWRFHPEELIKRAVSGKRQKRN